MPENANPSRRLPIGGLILILLGGILLLANLRPEFNPWPLVSKYWPLLLIFLGLAKLWDYFRLRRDPQARKIGLASGVIILLFIFLLFGFALSRQRGSQREVHEVESVERGAAESVRAEIEMGAGELKISGGAGKLLEATFDYSEAMGKPIVVYNVSGNQGRLSISQESAGINIGRTNNSWDLRLNNDVPSELKIKMGAGQGDLRLRGLSLTRLEIQMGAGEVIADLTGDWKRDLDAKIEGGVGSATIRLPKNVGVRVRAEGGIGSINAHGLRRDAGFYVNDTYGKSKVTLRIDVRGGVGEINLLPEM